MENQLENTYGKLALNRVIAMRLLYAKRWRTTEIPAMEK